MEIYYQVYEEKYTYSEQNKTAVAVNVAYLLVSTTYLPKIFPCSINS